MDLTLWFLIGALLFAAVTAFGYATGNMPAPNGFARREDDPEWFRASALWNGCIAVVCVVAFLMMLAVRIFGKS